MKTYIFPSCSHIQLKVISNLHMIILQNNRNYDLCLNYCQMLANTIPWTSWKRQECIWLILKPFCWCVLLQESGRVKLLWIFVVLRIKEGWDKKASQNCPLLDLHITQEVIFLGYPLESSRRRTIKPENLLKQSCKLVHFIEGLHCNLTSSFCIHLVNFR